MTVADGGTSEGAVSSRRGWQFVHGIQLLLGLIVGYAVVTVNLTLLINAGIPLVITTLPWVLDRLYGHQMGVGLAAWISIASVLHAVGALGPYTMFGWYDSVTHTVSATLVAGAGYAIVDAIDRSSEAVDLPGEFRFVFILVFVLAFGVLWEIAEFASAGFASLLGGEPVLAQYGTDDIVFDLIYNAVGAVLVALWATGYFDGVAGLLDRRIEEGDDTS
ncbi:hypothetical protein C479_04062 [Halovivax asiaticus JCM 14624]|uniref:Membrane-spanning protein n=1 Tax=Halovivax asiaticus JCM 14624 TaxID=1227490 RepID=M0BS95_9EURY|nr:hypothetical protein [Halovivax asiaticus]ELZ12539.1 hypothetical protein C479_04062 [Halovivax asiaticus JCM 14624]